MTITCPECESRFKVAVEMVGKKAKCGACQHVFVVPDAQDVPLPVPAPSVADARELAWTSLYLGGLAALLLLFRGGLGGLIATLLLALATESAAIFFAFRGWRDARLVLQAQPGSHLGRTGFLVNGVLLGLVALSALLTIYQLVAGQGSGLGSLSDLLKGSGSANDILKSLTK
jgi:predicted Zn finger-like uncharacterized protein